jgi:uncharacterized Ntn-hydrolase superfamily protein
MRFQSIRALMLAALVASQAANATFSIAACDKTGDCGVAVATNNLSVGATVPYASAGIGALATHFETNPNYGPLGLSLLTKGVSARQCLAALLESDGNFEGLGTDFRQVSVVSPNQDAATFTGDRAQAARWAGGRHGPGYAIIGNGLEGERVVAQMEAAFLGMQGSLATRLMTALAAGESAGGQRTGGLSASLLVRTRAGGFQDVDLRVDANTKAVDALGRLLDMRLAHEAMLRAERLAGSESGAAYKQAIADALRLAPAWDRIWLRAARLEQRSAKPMRTCEYLAKVFALNPAWGAIAAQEEFREACPCALRSHRRSDAGDCAAGRAPPSTRRAERPPSREQQT